MSETEGKIADDEALRRFDEALMNQYNLGNIIDIHEVQMAKDGAEMFVRFLRGDPDFHLTVYPAESVRQFHGTKAE